MKSKYSSNLVEYSHSLFTNMKGVFGKAGLVALIGAIIGVGSATIGKVEPKEQSLSKQSVSLEDRLLKQTKIAFRVRGGFSNSEEIYVMNPDGSEQRNLTNNPFRDEQPSWSPDGKKILFWSDRTYIRKDWKIIATNIDVYVMNADGSGEKRLTYNLALDGRPCWSPDGKKIAFESSLIRYGNREICVINADGSGQKNLTNSPDSDWYARWSPDGKKIAYMSNRNGNWQICVMNADGSGQKNFTNNPANHYDHAWSPDSKKIAFNSNRDGNDQIYVINADGSGQKNLTNNPNYNYDPSWSPDGKKIVFVSKLSEYGNREIYVMGPDGSEQRNLTDNPDSDKDSPCWSPDGEKIAFVMYKDIWESKLGHGDIYIMNADGSGQTRLTNTKNHGASTQPSWSPFLPLENKTD